MSELIRRRSFINRDYSRTQHDDFVLRVSPVLERNSLLEALEVYADGVLVGWKIQNRYE